MILRWRAESQWHTFRSSRVKYFRVDGMLYGRAGGVQTYPRLSHYRDLLWWYAW